MKPIEFQIVENHGLARSGQWTGAGIPVKRSELFSVEQLVLERGDSEVKLEAAFRPLSRWDDGSVKWLYVECIVDSKKSETITVRLTENKAIESNAKESQLPVVSANNDQLSR